VSADGILAGLSWVGACRAGACWRALRVQDAALAPRGRGVRQSSARLATALRPVADAT